MKTLRRTAVVLTAVQLLAVSVSAQTISLTPPAARRWDATGHIAWLGGNKGNVAAEWNDWFDTLEGGASGGRYVTPNLKAEIAAAFGARAEVASSGTIFVPGVPYPVYQYEEHRFTTSRVSAGVAYQFGRNRWLHPFVGAGIDGVRERHEFYRPEQLVPGRPGQPPQTVPATARTDRVTFTARPYASVGLKLYLAEHAFIRSDLRSSFSRRGAEYVSWSAGIGVDL